MRSFWTVLRNELLRKVRSPLAPAVYLSFPVLFALLIGLAFGSRGDKVAPVKIALVDDDKGFAARMVKSSFSQAKSTERFDIEPVDTMEEGMRLVENDKASALIRIPPGFTDSLFAGDATHLEVVKNPAQGIYPQIAEEYVKVLALGGGSAARILTGPLKAIRTATEREEAPTDAFIADVSVAINHRMRGVGRYAIPPAIRVEDVKHPSQKSSDDSSPFRIALFVLPGMAVFSIMMMSLGSVVDFQRETAHGTLARQLLAPVRAYDVILGKIGATWILGMACIIILAFVAVIWAGAGIGSVPGFLLLSLVFSLAATGFAAVIQSLSRSERAGPLIGSILVMIMSMVGGTWIPVDSLPGFVRRLSPYTLNYWAGEGYRRLMFDDAGAAQLLPNITILLGLGAVLSVLATIVFKRRFEVGG